MENKLIVPKKTDIVGTIYDDFGLTFATESLQEESRKNIVSMLSGATVAADALGWLCVIRHGRQAGAWCCVTVYSGRRCHKAVNSVRRSIGADSCCGIGWSRRSAAWLRGVRWRVV